MPASRCAAPTSAGTASRATTSSRATASRSPSHYRAAGARVLHTTAGRDCAVIGGVRGPRPLASPALDGRYVYADYCNGRLRSFDPSNPGGSDRATGLDVSDPSSFGDGPKGAQSPHSAASRRTARSSRPESSGSRSARELGGRGAMESATQRPASAQPPAGDARTARLRRARPFEVHRPVDGSLIRDAPDRLARAGRRGRRPRPRRAARLGGDRLRRPPPLARAACATGCSPTRTRSTT